MDRIMRDNIEKFSLLQLEVLLPHRIHSGFKFIDDKG